MFAGKRISIAQCGMRSGLCVTVLLFFYFRPKINHKDPKVSSSILQELRYLVQDHSISV